MTTARFTDALRTESRPFSALKQFARPQSAVERCELCGAALESVHGHLLEKQSRKIACSCEPCAILFCGQEGARYLRIPNRPRALRDFSLSDIEWEQLAIPIQLAFFFRDSNGRVIAMYPSPAGAIESELSLGSLTTTFERSPALNSLEPCVEALLVNRVAVPHIYMLAPIDRCFELVGLIRTKWRGLSGGTEVWGAISTFFRELNAMAEASRGSDHA